jgi:hypothetical protein
MAEKLDEKDIGQLWGTFKGKFDTSRCALSIAYSEMDNTRARVLRQTEKKFKVTGRARKGLRFDRAISVKSFAFFR